MKIFRAALWLVVFLSGVTFGASRAVAQKPAAKMTVSYSASGGQYINLFAAKEFGIFEKHGQIGRAHV